MSGSTIYPLQKTREAVNGLALSEAPIRERLLHAASALQILRTHRIPSENLQEKLEEMLAKIFDNAKPNDRMLAHMTDGDIAFFARQIVELFESCVSLYSKSPNLTS